MKTKLETLEFLLPAYWASYLINCDSSGLTEEEQLQADQFCEAHNCSGTAVDCGEAFFHWRNDANSLGGDVCQFTFLVRTKPETTKQKE